jgi:hypothetical protein
VTIRRLAGATARPTTGRSRRTRITVAIVGSVGLVGALAACGSQPGPTRGVLPTTIATPPASSSPSAATSDGPAPSPSLGPGTSASAAAGGDAVAVDQALLSFVPISGHGLIQTIDPDTTAEVAQDPDLRDNATALMIASYIPAPTASSASTGGVDDIAVVSVVRLRDPAADDTWFRAWRDSYDAAACANAGGVARNSQTEIGSHTVFIGACNGGSFTYHTRVSDGAILISITSIGTRHLGETIMERLAP